MSKGMHLSVYIDWFLAAHPNQDGWKVYGGYDDEIVSEIHIDYLLDFLRDRHPEAVTSRTTVNDVCTDDLLGTPNKSHAVEPDTEWDHSKELDALQWTGLIELEWQGRPIHYYAFERNRRIGPAQRDVMVATTSNAALRSLHAALRAYGDMREPKDRVIKVVNGLSIPIPQVCWDDVVLPPGFADDIRNNVAGFFRSQGRYRELGLPYRRGFLFTGSPGCGKTLTLKALASTVDATFITVLTRSRVDEGDIHHAFHLASKHSPAIILLEDLDRLVTSRELSLSYFLNLLDGFKTMDGVLVIATCNDPSQLDPALVHRPSRFDRIWRFPLPKYDQRRQLLRKKGRPYFSDTALDQAAHQSNGFSMAYVQEIIVNALLACAHAGTRPDDTNLFHSLKTLKAQRKTATKEEESLADRESLGFAPQRKSDPFDDDPDELDFKM